MWTVLIVLLASALVHGKKPTLWTELGINPMTNEPYNILIDGLEATGGSCDSGSQQSPIDISGCTKGSMGALRLTGHNETRADGFTMKHTGHTAQITFSGDAPTISGGPLSATYVCAQMHFHWGESNDEGTEHAVNGNYGALEAHFVHYKEEYNDVTTAITHADGLAVVGVIFVEQEDDNPLLEGMLSKLAEIPKTNDTVALDGDALSWMTEIMQFFGYYNYAGSLTTSPCSEVVTWLVMKKKLGVSADQVARFRELLDEAGANITDNEYRRHPQPLKNRQIKCAIGCALNP